jgi:hypothetical protein
MTEAEWLDGGADVVLMLRFLQGQTRKRKIKAVLSTWATARKIHLAVIACCRLAAPWLKEEVALKALAAAEKRAEGSITSDTAQKWFDRVLDVVRRTREGTAEYVAYGAVCDAVAGHAWNFILERAVQRTLHAALLAAGYSRCDESRASRAVYAAKNAEMVPLLRCVFGNPYRLPQPLKRGVHTWDRGRIPRLAAQIYERRDFSPARLGALADALDEGGYTEPEMAAHLRERGPHVRGCWVVDFLLGKR